MEKKEMSVTTTQRKIDGTTYIVAASPSEKATDNLDKKIEKLILKEIGTPIEKARK